MFIHIFLLAFCLTNLCIPRKVYHFPIWIVLSYCHPDPSTWIWCVSIILPSRPINCWKSHCSAELTLQWYRDICRKARNRPWENMARSNLQGASLHFNFIFHTIFFKPISDSNIYHAYRQPHLRHRVHIWWEKPHFS